MKVMIVDDEKLALSRLQRLLGETGIDDVKAFEDPLAALEEAKKTQFDAVFLDISMPKMDGLELAEAIFALEPHTFIIFQTAHEDFALQAYKTGGFDYLLKPIELASVQKVVQRIKHFRAKQQTINKKIIAKNGSQVYLIDIDEIYYIKADLDEVIIRIKEASAYAKKKISDFEELLREKNFYRIHRSYIINVDKIKSMQSVEQSKLQIAFQGINEMVTSSKDGAKEFREYLERRSL
ncbi:MAG: response regulator transcription factor [Sulfurospirillum sp.]|nr:response regulator transcription factor [Sulfurospirillum sp.]